MHCTHTLLQPLTGMLPPKYILTHVSHQASPAHWERQPYTTCHDEGPVVHIHTGSPAAHTLGGQASHLAQAHCPHQHLQDRLDVTLSMYAR